MNEIEIRQKTAQRRIQAFERKFGSGALKLASHAALPIVLNHELLRLIRTNFFPDSSSISDTAETDLLLSRLCRELDDDLYEMEPIVRDILLKRLVAEYSDDDLRQVATLLLEYTERETPWADRVWIGLAQKLTAWNILKPERVEDWFDWSKAMGKEIEDMIKIIGQDGRSVVNHDLSRPLQEFDSKRFLSQLEAPLGALKPSDRLYVEREADRKLKREMMKWGTTLTIKGARQTGKTSLLVRALHVAKESGTKVVFLDFQSFGTQQLNSADLFLRQLAEAICHELRLDDSKIEKAWRGSQGAQLKLTYFLEDEILPEFEQPLILAMDEADSLLQTSFYQDFFGLIRSWHNRRVFHEEWQKLNLVIVISTEPYLLIDNLNQSPFNVGLKLELTDFTETQVKWLNQQHGAPLRMREIPLLMRLLNGQPYLTRQALYTLVTQGLSWSELVQHAATDQGPFGQHLRRHYWAIHDKPELKNALKEVIDANHCSDENSCLRLLRAGLIKDSGEAYTCRCDLYKEYFKDKL